MHLIAPICRSFFSQRVENMMLIIIMIIEYSFYLQVGDEKTYRQVLQVEIAIFIKANESYLTK